MNPSPVTKGSRLYAAHGEEIPGRATVGRVACLEIGGDEPKIIWEKDGIEFKYPSPLLVGEKLFLPDRQGRLYCFDAEAENSSGVLNLVETARARQHSGMIKFT